uniref:Putative AP3 n=1 Tax=Davidia involucrata TaxID=16924 RepID=A0A5B7BVC5_DAVIN
MARGKIQIKRIENSTNRQVTYSKRRNGLFKKAHELTVLCDAKVSIIMFSSTTKLHEYISPSITTKRFFDQYQKTVGIDLWNSHYERMHENLRKLKEVNRNLRREIRQRMGDSLNDLNFDELRGLEQDMESSLKFIRDRKFRVIGNQIDTCKKKVRNGEEIHRNLLHEFASMEARGEDPHYGFVDNGGDYGSVFGCSHGGPSILALRLQPNHPSLHTGGGSDHTTYASA